VALHVDTEPANVNNRYPIFMVGISASILRQSTYSTRGLGVYNNFAGKARERSGAMRLSSGTEIVCGRCQQAAWLVLSEIRQRYVSAVVGKILWLTRGGIGALVRMCADGANAPAQRFGYNHVFHAIARIGREEGARTFTRGLGPMWSVA